jgi:uncharacterized membrane protein YfcA
MGFDLWWLAYPALGAVAGFLAGLIGIGGGGMMVPILTSVFLAQGMPLTHVVHLSLGTAMAVMVITAVSSFRTHHRLGSVRWDIWRMMTPGILIGAFGTTFLAAQVPSQPLAFFFACFMGLMAVQMMINIKPSAVARSARPARGGRRGHGYWQHFFAGGDRRGGHVGTVHDVVQRKDPARHWYLGSDRLAGGDCRCTGLRH